MTTCLAFGTFRRMDAESLKREFRRFFGREAEGIAAAPGRVNRIGEHTDYNDGFVLPIAIERRTLAAWAPREDGRLHLNSMQQPDKPAEVRLSGTLEPGEPAWANYPKGVAVELMQHGVVMSGCDILFDSDMPLNAGLSSSAALEVAAAVVMLKVCGAWLPPGDLARLCQKAEVEFVGAPCGIMDQSISIMARPGHALLLDCRTVQTKQIPFNDPRAVLLVADTQVKHDIGEGGYPQRRRQCEQAASALGVRSLRDADVERV